MSLKLFDRLREIVVILIDRLLVLGSLSGKGAVSEGEFTKKLSYLCIIRNVLRDNI